jgi:hypothetical protein
MTQAPTDALLTEDEFVEQFNPQCKPSGDLLDYVDVQSLDIHHVWTVVETGDDEDPNWYADPGFHIVNVLGYVISDKPWTNDTPLAVYFDAS